MRAITVTQPWAGLIAAGVKLVENRPRPIVKREDFGLPFAIHASRVIDESVYASIYEIAPELRDGYFAEETPLDTRWYKLSRITSAVIAVATIDRVVHSPSCTHPSLSWCDECLALIDDLGFQHRWFFGPIGYVLRDVRALATPVPCRGWQGFWTLDGDVAAKVEAQL
jgi:hypothetical protein